MEIEYFIDLFRAAELAHWEPHDQGATWPALYFAEYKHRLLGLSASAGSLRDGKRYYWYGLKRLPHLGSKERTHDTA